MRKRKRGDTVRRSVLLVLSVALAVLVLAPVAAAQSDDMGADDRGMDARGPTNGGWTIGASTIAAWTTTRRPPPSPAPIPLRRRAHRAALRLPRVQPPAPRAVPPLPLRATFPTPAASL